MAKIYHRGGGEITRVEAIAHKTYEGVAEWFFIGDVAWRDGGHSLAIGIAPTSICYDGDEPDAAEAQARINELLSKLNAYLEANGTWHDDKRKRDGRVYRWTPHKPADTLKL